MGNSKIIKFAQRPMATSISLPATHYRLHKEKPMKRVILFCLLIAGFAALPSAAGTKEDLMRLQKDVQALRDQMQEIDKSFNEKMDGIKSLVVQLNDQVAKSNLLLIKIPALLESQNTSLRSADDALLRELGKVSTKLNDLNELSTRISAISRDISELKVQVKNQESSSTGSQSPEVMYNQAYNDFVLGKFDMAIQEFTVYVDTYPGGEKAAAALLYLGDACLAQKKLPQAIIAFTRVINNYSDNTASVASALFKRAKAELEMNETQNAIDDLKNIVSKYPTAQEAENAKAKLLELGVGAKPAPTGRKPR
jgi:TolA-binding protein